MTTRRRNVPSDIAAFWKRIVFERSLARAVKVETKKKPLGPETIVTIDDKIPGLPFLGRKPRYLVTTTGARLTVELFGDDAPRKSINRNRSKARGRVINLIDMQTDEELAAISFHIHGESETPVILRTVALRVDSQEMADLSLACAGWLLAYLVEVSRQAKLPAVVGADEGKQSNPSVLRVLGFKNGERPDRFACVGTYLVFRSPRR
jgi:hypothetical protein